MQLQGTVVSKRYVGRHVLFISLSNYHYRSPATTAAGNPTIDVLLKSAGGGGHIAEPKWLELKRCIRLGDVLDVEVGTKEVGKGNDGADVVHAVACTIILLGDNRGTPSNVAAAAAADQANPAPNHDGDRGTPSNVAAAAAAGQANPAPNHDAVVQLLLGCGATDPEAVRQEEEALEERQDWQQPSPLPPTEAQFAASAMHCYERSKVFAWWAIQQYYGVTLGGGKGVILDVAGGTGELSLLFALSGIPSRLVDPRGGNLPKRQRKQLRRSGREAFERHASLFGGDGRAAAATTAKLLRGVSLVLGLHPDEATDFIVDAAIAAKVPFAVVPCCCFSRLFPHRRLQNGSRVGTTVQLCEYLLEKHPAMRAAVLPMGGQRRVLYLLDYGDVQGAAEDPETNAVKVELRAASKLVGNGRAADDCHHHP